MARTGRPPIDWDDRDLRTFEGLCAINCTQTEICSVMNVSDKTLNRLLRKYYKMTFSDCFKRFSASGIISLRRKQFEVATGGSVPMLIWLGKQYLNQKDKSEVSGEAGNAIEVVVRYAEELGTLHEQAG